jgi:hypothetical protein
LSGITFKEKGSHPSATVFGFTALQGATLSHISFEGYYSGTLLDIEGAILTAPLDDPATQWHTSNSIFNLFDDWAADGCAIGVKFAGVYGSTPTASPPGSSNAPSLVITQNVLNNFILEGVTTKAFDFVKCSDTNYIRDAIVFVNTTGAVVVQIGDDNGGGASAGNNYVNNIYADVSVSMSAPATAVTFFKAGNWTFGNVFTGITDVAPAAVTAIALDTNVTQFKYIYRGANWATGNLDSLGFNTNYMNIAAGEYHFLDNGTAGNPILRFFNDAGNGMFLPKAGIFGFSKGISSGHGGGGTSGSLTINGGTTGSFVIAVDSTGKLPISDPHVLGQCWNNGGVVTISAG